ncbi:MULTISPECIES: YlbD family protein [Heyndrickxia]|jgi:hypothetical protein|uniref:Cytosolic protein n=1 Tax=Heyndrickxia coagulans TaxID=1398 RepID=A0A150KF71_HEYCO|nr:YlbD family protein [Heyndrickxia coagulans]KYC61448.1 hypothetical protein B4098_2003 [Heyndrickxia coagulans]KYC69616.1 hypothetical protein B4099_0245 [Heyndrickxia coagulans]MED4344522.1 YlbD family protein [Heyndrickxia coagulans]MED4941061.1 YlbD family protein [Heyndrickxia coagulans]MED4966833.1 YlbD family protein [Heyndrickxia coagulans]
MGTKKLHPSVEKFKAFTKTHPLILKEVRGGKKSLQDFFEEWYILGEDDPVWEKYVAEGSGPKEKTGGKSSWLNQLGTMLENLDTAQVQGHLQHLTEAIAAVQNVITQFTGPQQAPQSRAPQPKGPFSFRKD